MALLCPLEYIDVSPTLFDLYYIQIRCRNIDLIHENQSTQLKILSKFINYKLLSFLLQPYAKILPI